MGKRITYLSALCMFVICLLSYSVFADEVSSVEQVYVNLPEVTVYTRNIETNQMEAALGERTLEFIKTSKFSDSGEPIYYYLLLDVSNSMPEAGFESIKQSILEFDLSLRADDRMIFYTFGESVSLLLDENHTAAETTQALMGVDNVDNKTLLFEAISQAADRAEQVDPEICKRKVIVVISDGEDFSTGKTMVQEAQENLKKKSIPVYAYGISETKRENLNSFGEFARNSGGHLTIFDNDQAGTVLQGLHNFLLDFDVILFKTETNIISNSQEMFSIRTSSKQLLTKEVMVVRRIKDVTVPSILYVNRISDNQVELEFSEPVTGCENAANYQVKNAGKVAAVAAVSIDKTENGRIILTFADALEPGTYQVSCANITDISMEANAVSNYMEFDVPSSPLSTRIWNAVLAWYWIFLIIVVAILLLIIVLVYRKIKKGNGIIYVDGKPVMASDVEIHEHVRIRERQGKEFQLIVRVKGGRPETMKVHLQDSFIIGRANINNLYFDDNKMSRQHFAIEWDGKDMYVQDLNTTNGTRVNGVKISKKRKLEQNDEIAAGSVTLRIRW
ncbi:MAG: FHA domain-containing protein [Lachnospiraceae bacterium]